jgi:hypothetical protein
MQLPPALRQAVDAALEGIPRASLAAAHDALSQRYRGEVRDGRAHLADDLSASAYLAARLPATYAAIRAALGAVAERRPDFAPRRRVAGRPRDRAAAPGQRQGGTEAVHGRRKRAHGINDEAPRRSFQSRPPRRLG